MVAIVLAFVFGIIILVLFALSGGLQNNMMYGGAIVRALSKKYQKHRKHK